MKIGRPVKVVKGLRWLPVLLTVLGCSVDPGAALAGENEAFYERLEQFHGHTCGGSLMGARLGLAAREFFGAEVATKDLRSEYFDHSCPVDGIQLAVGTTLGNQGLEVQDRDEHRLVVTDTRTGRRVEARLTDQALERARQSRELSRKARELPEGAEAQRLRAEVAAVFDWLRNAPQDEVVIVRPLPR